MKLTKASFRKAIHRYTIRYEIKYGDKDYLNGSGKNVGTDRDGSGQTWGLRPGI